MLGDTGAGVEVDLAERAPVYFQLFSDHGHGLRQYLAGVKRAIDGVIDPRQEGLAVFLFRGPLK